jgi:hypothetical protein
MKGRQQGLYNDYELDNNKPYKNHGSNIKLALQLAGLQGVLKALEVVDLEIDKAIAANKYNSYVLISLKQVGDSLESDKRSINHLMSYIKYERRDKHYAGD